ncbi:MAG: NAD(P)/FAD-dependent oxidoreductase [Marinoscillum sp.]
MPKLITSRTRIEDLNKPRIIIIGGGFGGMELIKKLKGSNAQVVLFDKHNHHTFQPLLYQVATSALQTNSIVYPFRKKFNDYQDFYFRLAEVTRVVPDENRIETSIGSVKYDYLVLATGSTSNYFGQQSFEDNTLPLKTIEDAIVLRNRLITHFELALLEEDSRNMNSYIDYVIVGGGPTGVEVAGALAELKRHVFPRDYKELDMKEMDIHLVEAAPRLLNVMSERASEKALEYLQQLGVKVHLNCQLKSYDGFTAKFDAIDEIISRSVIWAAGVKGKGIQGLNEDKYTPAGRLMVNEYNLVESYENIFAIGDVACQVSDKYPRGYPMMAPAAIAQGKLLAANLKRMIKGKSPKAFKYQHKGNMATIGRNLAVTEIGAFRIYGFFGWLIWIFVHLMALVSFKNRIAVFFTWMIGYLSFDKSNRFIIGNNYGPK